MSLESCHSQLARVMGSQAEAFPIVNVVEQHRRYWRPAKTRLVLLAESHVHTDESEYCHTVRPLVWMPKDLPLDFVRFVYCLGYGENELLNKPINRNGGTPQFWKIFYSCINKVTSNNDFAPILKRKTQLAGRACTKMSLLDAMKTRGIWLVDASIMAVYPRTHVNLQNFLQTSWNCYVRSVIHEAKPEGILCIGFGVAKALKAELDKLQSALGIKWGVVPQPNARLVSKEHLCIFDAYRRVTDKPKHARALSKKWFRQCFPVRGK
jgi:hypothetical protein